MRVKAFVAVGLMGLVLLAAGVRPVVDAVAGAHIDKEAQKIFVDCSQGNPLGHALRSAREGDTIVVTGTCSEKVTITVDRLTLDGQGTAIIDGHATACHLESEAVEGLVEIDAAQGVVLTGLTVQNSPVDGIFLRNSAAAIIRDTTVQHNCDDGIHLAQSVATVENAIFQENKENGMNVFNTSAVSVSNGSVAFNNNGLFGVQNQHSVVAVHGGASLKANNNDFMGVAVFAGGRVIAFTSSQLSINNNVANGMLLLDGGVSAAYATIEVVNNGRQNTGSYLRRDNVVSVLYSEGLNSTKSSVFLQRTDRHGIVGQKSSDFQRFL